jgi:hypothetical protein
MKPACAAVIRSSLRSSNPRVICSYLTRRQIASGSSYDRYCCGLEMLIRQAAQ